MFVSHWRNTVTENRTLVYQCLIQHCCNSWTLHKVGLFLMKTHSRLLLKWKNKKNDRIKKAICLTKLCSKFEVDITTIVVPVRFCLVTIPKISTPKLYWFIMPFLSQINHFLSQYHFYYKTFSTNGTLTIKAWFFLNTSHKITESLYMFLYLDLFPWKSDVSPEIQTFRHL